MKVDILSFSFKHGFPDNPSSHGNVSGAIVDQVGLTNETNDLSQNKGSRIPQGFVFDCRAMPNPFWDENLRYCTGRDKSVKDFFARIPKTIEPFLKACETLVRQSIEQYGRDGRERLQVAFGCTGGQHRSVYFAERMAECLADVDGLMIEITHTAMPYWKTEKNRVRFES